jgi:pSer/pThr/pTyr-binding forkhead associated (FHA) protein
MKGKIEVFSKEVISIGRNLSNDLRFPASLTIVSRNHAQIMREGNRFRLMDKSANGTFVNGKRASEDTFLKDGDVIEFAPGGPKVSFLTEMNEEGVYEEEHEEITIFPQRASSGKLPERNAENAQYIQMPDTLKQSRQSIVVELSNQPVQASLVIQYGPSIRSYKELPITIGRHPKCNFVLDRPGILNEHVQILYANDRYWVKDLTGQNQVCVNGQPIGFQQPLSVNDTISFSATGPIFRFIGEGRLAEAEEG